MPNIFTLIGQSWELYKSQPVLNSVLVWLMIFPMSVLQLLAMLEEQYSYTEQLWNAGSYGALFLNVCIYIACTLLLVWGTACTLIIGKKLISSRAGRSRSSFGTLRKQGRKYIIPILFTGILQQCFVFFWALLLVVPGLIYAIRTFFYQVIIVAEGKQYRDALKKSKNAVLGHTWTTLLHLIGIGILLFLPVYFIDDMSHIALSSIDERLLPAQVVISGSIYSFASMISTLTIIGLYAAVKKLPKKA